MAFFSSPQRLYTRLTRQTSYSFFARHSLWLGPDHLLSIHNHHYSEEYRRFAFREIEAIIVRGTNRGRLERYASAGLLLLFVVVGWQLGDQPGRLLAAGLGGACGVVWLLSLIAGPTCLCYIRTAISLEELPSLRRWRRARKVVARLRGLIEHAQGPLPAAAVEEFYRTIPAQAPPPPAQPAPT